MKHVLSYALVTLVGALLLAAPASAQVTAGLNEVGIRGFVETGKYSSEAENSKRFDLSVYYGRFVTKRLEVGPGLSVFKFANDDATGAYNGFVDYHFGDASKTLVSYAEAALGQFFGGTNGKPVYFAAGPGVKWFFADGGGALNATAFYRRQFYDADLNGGATGANEFALNIGVAIYFGR